MPDPPSVRPRVCSRLPPPWDAIKFDPAAITCCILETDSDRRDCSWVPAGASARSGGHSIRLAVTITEPIGGRGMAGYRADNM